MLILMATKSHTTQPPTVRVWSRTRPINADSQRPPATGRLAGYGASTDKWSTNTESRPVTLRRLSLSITRTRTVPDTVLGST